MKTWPLLLCTCLLLSHCREKQSTTPAQPNPEQAEQLDTLRPTLFTTGIAAQCENHIRADLRRNAAAQLIRQADAYDNITAILGSPERTASPLDGHERIISRYENLRKTLEQRNCYGSDRLQQAFHRLSQIGSH